VQRDAAELEAAKVRPIGGVRDEPAPRLSARDGAVGRRRAHLRWLDPDGCVAARSRGSSCTSRRSSAPSSPRSKSSAAGSAPPPRPSRAISRPSCSGSPIHLAIFIKATGAVFAKAWDGLKIVYAGRAEAGGAMVRRAH
jgi:hypothetical protein